MYCILEHNLVKSFQKLLLLKTCVVQSRFNDNALSAMYRFSIWAFLMRDMHYIFDLLNIAFPFLIKALIVFSVKFLWLANFAVSAWLYIIRYTDLLQRPTTSVVLPILL